MALIGPDGNDLPDVMADGVTSYDYVAIRSRVYTAHNREAFAPDFGVGLVHALRTPTLSQGEIARRLERSLAGETLSLRAVTVRVAGAEYTIRVRLEV